MYQPQWKDILIHGVLSNQQDIISVGVGWGWGIGISLD